MSPQDDSNRDSVQSYAEWWTAKSLFTGEAAEEPAPVVNEWYQVNAPFLEGRELQEMYGSEAEEEDYPTELEDEEPDEEAYEPTYEALLYQEALAGENEYSITQSVGTERLLQEHFDSLIGEAKALLDEMASDLRRYDFADMSEAEIEALLNQYQLVGTPHHQGFEYLLNDVQDMAKRLLRGTVNLTRPQTRQAGFQPISSFQYTFEREQKQTVQQYQLNTTGAKRYTTADGLFYRFPVGRHHKNNIKRPQFQHPESSMVTYKGAGASREEVKIHPAVSTALHNLMSALRAEGTRINDESMKLAVVASGFRAPTEAEGRRYLQALKKTIAQNPTIFGALTFPSNLENMARSELGSGGAPAFIAFRNAIASRQGWNGRLADQLLSITGGFKAPRGASTHHSGLAVDINFPYVTSDSKVQRHSMNRERNSDAFRAAAGVWLNAYAPAFGFDTYNTKKEIWHQEWRNWGGTPADPASQQPREQEEIVEPEVEEPGEFITELAGEEFDEAVEERIAQEAFADFLADEEELENISSGKEAYIPASRLQWPEASQQQREFMRRVYEKQVRRAVRKRPFRGDVPEAELGFIEEGHKARIKAATACRALLAAARTALDQQKREGLKQAQKVKSIYALSAYRSASEQFSNWQGNFPRYYQDTRANRAAQEDGEHGEAAAEYLARYIGRRLAAPGFSLHNSGLAVDFGTIEGKRRLGASTSASSISQWKQSWLFRWLTENAPTFNYYQNRSIEEPWHWEHGKPAEDASQETLLEQEAEEEALGGFVADEEEEQETEEFLDEQYAQEAGTASATVPSPTSPITSQLSKGSVFQQLQEALHRGAWSLVLRSSKEV